MDKNIYSKTETNEENKTWFLSLVDQVVTVDENVNLKQNITLDELQDIINSMDKNKSPGIDGIPVEFYQTHWEVIKHELCEIVNESMSVNLLSESQRKAVIVLIEKGDDPTLLSSWRPISLLCVDTKIIAKIIASRLKAVIDKCISKNQFCSPVRNIIDCNNVMRDTLYYANDNNIQGAIINVDWCKAFDSVDHDLLFGILLKMGFCSTFVDWIRILYNGAVSLCIVNGFMTQSFNIERGVRQGCPLSMLLFVIFQEPLYRAIELSVKVKPIMSPCTPRKLLGYADDTSFIVADETSIIECFLILKKFELASGIKLNKNKTKLYGIGSWKNRQQWPVQGIKVLTGNIKILGIYFNNDYDQAVLNSWTKVIEALKIKINLLLNRKFNIYQKAIIVNCMILSKVWYTCHTYPLSYQHSKTIDRLIFPYIWNSKSDPLKRDVLCNRKEVGGINLLNVHIKATSIFTKSFIRSFMFSGENSTLVKFYCALQLNPLFKIRELPENVSFTSTPFYSSNIDTVRKCYKLNNFPNVTSQHIYESLIKKHKPIVEEKYSLFNWETIWENVSSKFISSDDRSVLFKYMHEILPNKLRLYNIKKNLSPNCETCNIEENNLHMVYFCEDKKVLVQFLRVLLQKCLNITNLSLVKLLFLDTTGLNKKDSNTVTALVTSFICNIWYNRDNNGDKLKIWKRSVIKKQSFQKIVLRNKMPKIFNNQYCKINMKFLDNIFIPND